ncbi:hypothetical protein SAMN04489724_3066 [Algoriphagus locisalis]|uniref:Chaperone of endosialidase n=1 Tax=Algoriphagus locisalis TaxID=305507 RepID=A0A1I7CCL8_9BACT|nr:hypothetical protein [Algoriphagus locisalis]SFT97162.1 hypothetical protein SAMN04489724_3066 [Algoriphagus locisalis]
MKISIIHVLTLLVSIGSILNVSAQTTTFDYMNSNVGSQKTISWNTSSFGSGFGHRLISSDPGGATTLNLQARHNSATWKDAIVINSLGYVGFGVSPTTNPFHLLSIAGQRSRFQYGNTTLDLVDYSSSIEGFSNSSGLFINGKDGLIMTGQGYNLKFVTNESGPYIERMRISKNGNIGIGTVSPTEKLSVNGKIKAHEINITTSDWADYVFKTNYELMPLSEVEAFINKNGHLPNVPKEKEVLEHGVNLLEMNKKLLEKVEELTLYVIELQKNNNELKSRIELLENKN